MSLAGVLKRLPNFILTGLGARQSACATCFCNTLKAVYKPVHRNVKKVTVSLPETLLRRFRVFATSRDQSMTSLMAEAMTVFMGRDANSEKAKRRFLDRIERAPDRGTGGAIRWNREELHDSTLPPRKSSA
jgi:hypothetical protein